MFDWAIFAYWPRGLFLAKKLAESGQKTAYVELLPQVKSPFGFFIDENLREEKEFLQSLGFLFQQEGGFCLLSPQGVWPLQDMLSMREQLPVLNRDSSNNFESHWLNDLSFNLAGKVFEYNNSEFSNQGLNLFSDYFLFEPSIKKIKQFQNDHSSISFYKAYLKDISCDEQAQWSWLAQKKLLKSEKSVWLNQSLPVDLKQQQTIEPYWRWESCFFKTDFGDYKKIIPSHFVFLKDIFLPWTHDNLLSVFHRDGLLEVWMRWPEQGKKNIYKEVEEHLKMFFPGSNFISMMREGHQGPAIYGRESLSSKFDPSTSNLYIEDLNHFFQADIISEIRAEKRLFKELFSKDYGRH